jgi:hypothetical protein
MTADIAEAILAAEDSPEYKHVDGRTQFLQSQSKSRPRIMTMIARHTKN